MSTPIPAACSGTTMSLNRIAASTRCLRTGCSVISQISSGVRQAASMLVSARRARYSGSERPAWRMNHTGTCAGRRPRAAARNGASDSSRRAGTIGGAVGTGADETAMTSASSHVRAAHRAALPRHAHVARSGPGAPVRGRPRCDLESRLVPDPTVAPAAFRHAVAELSAVRPRPELIVSPLEAPPRLAPFTWAMSAEADAARRPGEDLDEPDTSGRLILLHDPAGQDAWEGTFRLVCFVQARLDPEQLGDEMLPLVAWSWLTEALEQRGATYLALGGTVTQTSLGPLRGHRRSAP